LKAEAAATRATKPEKQPSEGLLHEKNKRYVDGDEDDVDHDVSEHEIRDSFGVGEDNVSGAQGPSVQHTVSRICG
jgi:hypothetical protein